MAHKDRRVLSLALWFAAASPAAASFQSMPGSLKAAGLGGAFIALADDPTALFHNCAGLARLDQPQLSMMYGSPMAGVQSTTLNHGYLALGSPLTARLSGGLGVTAFQAAGLLKEYQGMAGLSYAPAAALSVGVGMTYLYHVYEIASDPSFSNATVFSNGRSKGAVGFDLGVLASPAGWLQLGASVRNANAPDVGLSEKDPAPRLMSAGAMYQGRLGRLLAEVERRDGMPATGSAKATVLRLGAEVATGPLAVRAGLSSDGASAGLGLRLGRMGFDYALSMLNNAGASAGNHNVSLSIKLGRQRRRPK